MVSNPFSQDRPLRQDLLSRRQALGILGGAGAAIGLAGCQVQLSGDEPSAPTEAPELVIPDPKVDLPTDDVTFRWIDSGDLKALFEEPVLEAYTKKHPNITTEYDGNGWEQVNQVVPLGIRNKSAPDIFALPQTVPARTAIDEGWVQPVQDLIPDFENWKSAFPENTFIPGVHIFDDVVYTWPMTSVRRLSQMMFFDVANMQAGGYENPVEEIETWDQVREAAKNVTKAGKGKFYGYMVSGKSLGTAVIGFALTNGWHQVDGQDLTTGEYVYAAQPVLDAIEFLRSLQADKSIFPGFGSLNEAEARGRMPNGVAGMIVDGPWDIPQWPEVDPDWKFDLRAMPTPEAGGTYTVPFQEKGGNMSWVYKDAKYPEIAGDIYSYMGSVEGQTQLVILSQGNLASLIPEATKKANVPGLLDPHAQQANKLATELMRNAPMAEIRNADAAKVSLKKAAVTPNFNDIIEGLFTGQLTDAKAELTKYSDKLNQGLDTAIAAAKKNGAKVSREDYAFANWDPAKDYTQADYDEL